MGIAQLTLTKGSISSTACFELAPPVQPPVVWNSICSGYFQCAMDTILQGIPHVLYYIEDLLITDETEETSSQPQEGAEMIFDPWNCAREVHMFFIT